MALSGRCRCAVSAFEPDFSSQDLNPNVACATHPDGPSSAAAEIDRATLHKRTAIIDPNYHRSTSVGVRNSNSRAKGKGSVSRGLFAVVGRKPVPARHLLGTQARPAPT